MIRPLLALLAAFGLALPLAAAAPVRQWDTVAAAGPQGTIVIGNPQAPVRLTEYLSYTCSHCARFSEDSDAELRQGLIRRGRVVLEVRNLYRDPLDLAAAVVARCRPQRMAAVGAALFHQQEAIGTRANAVAAEVAGRNQGAAPNVLLKDFARSTGLFDIAAANGVTTAQLDACFATRTDLDRLEAQRAATPAEVTGTPTFAVAGRIVPVNTWAGIRPLVAAPAAAR